MTSMEEWFKARKRLLNRDSRTYVSGQLQGTGSGDAVERKDRSAPHPLSAAFEATAEHTTLLNGRILASEKAPSFKMPRREREDELKRLMRLARDPALKELMCS